MALIKVIILAAVLLGLATGGVVYTRSDSILSGNRVNGSKALYAASGAAELGKGWLADNWRVGAFPYSGISLALPETSAAATISVYPDPRKLFRIHSTGTGPRSSRRVVDEVVQVGGGNATFALINVNGMGTHSDLQDSGGGTGVRIPDFTVDGRNHAPNGNLDPSCPDVPVVAGTQSSIQTDVSTKLNGLRCNIVQRANSSICNSPGGNCTPALWWVRSLALSTNGSCDPAISTFDDLDLSAPELRASDIIDPSATPAAVATAPDADDPLARGPLLNHIPYLPSPPAGSGVPLVQVLDSAGIAQLEQAAREIVDLAILAPLDKKECITSDLSNVELSFGTWADPKIVFVSDPNDSDPRVAAYSNSPPCNGAAGGGNPLDVENGAVISGTGILITSKTLAIKSTFNWRGLIVLLKNGQISAVSQGANAPCGAIYGTVLVTDYTGNDPKVDIDTVELSDTCPNPFADGTGPPQHFGFSFNASCAAIDRARGALLTRTLAWLEDFGA